MRSLIKPPVLSRIILSFHKYEEKRVDNKVRKVRLKRMLVKEKKSVYLLTVNFFFLSTYNHLAMKYENFFFQNFISPLYLEISYNDFFTKYITNHTYMYIQKTLFLFVKSIFRRDILFLKNKVFKKWNLNLTQSRLNVSIQNLIYYFGKFLYQRPFTRLRSPLNAFFFNIFYFFLLANFGELWKFSLNQFNNKIIFYFSFDFIKSIFLNKYDKDIIIFNKFLTMQTGVLKNTKYFTNINYLLTTSTQVLRSRKIFLLKFFFRSKNYLIFDWFKKKKKILDKTIRRRGIHTWGRSATILPFFINKILFIHNGTRFIWIRILPGMVGYKLGQFSFTRKIHPRGTNILSRFKNI